MFLTLMSNSDGAVCMRNSHSIVSTFADTLSHFARVLSCGAKCQFCGGGCSEERQGVAEGHQQGSSPFRLYLKYT